MPDAHDRSRISLISKSDIRFDCLPPNLRTPQSLSPLRYVGSLHEINSENSSVALENVKSYGTEGRRGNTSEEIPASDNVYEYIVFRGSDVKDLRIEEPPFEPPHLPQVPDDPAIMSVSETVSPPIH
jgi:protein LSM14